MKELVLQIAKALVDNPNRVEVKEVTGERTRIIELRVDPADRGKIIGREGRIIKAVRIIVNAAGAKTKQRVTVELVE